MDKSDPKSDLDSNLDYDPDKEEEVEIDAEMATDLLIQVEHKADRRLIGVYGDTIHRNDGRHLNGGITGDAGMVWLYDKVVINPHPMYLPPKGKSGNQFIQKIDAELKKVRTRETNSEQAMIFPACILR